MGFTAFFCAVVFCLIQPSMQFYVCSKPADVYLVVDNAARGHGQAEGHTDQGHSLLRQKSYLQNLVRLFPLSPASSSSSSSSTPSSSTPSSSTRVGLVVSGPPSPSISSPLGAAPSLPLLTKAIDSITVSEGEEREEDGAHDLAKTLRFLREEAFPQARPDVLQVAIVMTNGHYTHHHHHHRHHSSAEEEASALREQGVFVYTLSSGSPHSSVDWEGVRSLASSPAEDFVFSTADQAVKGSLMELLHLRPCDHRLLAEFLPPAEEKVCAPRREADVVFAVDHLALGTSKTRSLLTFVQAMLGEVEVTSPLRTTLLSSTDPLPLPLSTPLSPTQLVHHTLTGLHFPALHDLLTHAGHLLTTSPGSQDSQKVLVLFVDDKRQRVTKKALSAALLLKDAKVDIYVVYLYQEGSRVRNDMDDVASLASGRDHVIEISGYIRQLKEHQTSLVEDTLRHVCTGL